jgi:hypothetical protein
LPTPALIEGNPGYRLPFRPITVASLPQVCENVGEFELRSNEVRVQPFRTLKSGNPGSAGSAKGFLNHKGNLI